MARKARRQGTVTSRDVAARAGVSPMTVSRTLRTPELVTAGTRERVESAARELAYVPDLAAGSLASRRSGHVAVLLPSLRHTGFLRTVDGLSDTLRGHGYHMLIGDSYYSADEQIELLRLVIGRRPEAIVLVASMDSDEAHALLRQSGIPVVETWGRPDAPIDMAVGFSQHDAGRALTESLIEQGYTRIGFLAGPPHTDPYGEQRRLGHVAALVAHGLDPSIHVTVSDTPMEIADGVSGIAMLRARHPEADALVCATDMTALGALSECQRRGWRVPEDIAIAGHGNFDFAASLNPSLTSVHLPSYTIGVRAAELIIARIAADGRAAGSAPRLDLGFEVVHRESTRRETGGPHAPAAAAPPASDPGKRETGTGTGEGERHGRASMSGNRQAPDGTDTPGTTPTVVIVMGVSGCGKSTVAERLAARLGGRFKDGDELHPPANIDKMSSGVPLTDEDRAPWLEAVRDHAAASARAHGLAVIACSALKRRYRETLRGADADVFHVFLEGSRELIASRMSEREGHFMPASMLDSQFAALESPVGEPRVVTVGIDADPETIAGAAADALLARDDFAAPDALADPEPS